MKRLFCVFFAALLLVLASGVAAFAAPAQVTITMPDVSIEYSPKGFYPSASASAYKGDLKYTATETETGESVPLPIKRTGHFTVHAYMEESSAHYAASATATVVISKTKVYVEVTKPTVAHTAMDNPVQFNIVPSWAEEYISISTSYKSFTDGVVGATVDMPRDPARYLVHFTGETENENIDFAGKYLVYEIAEKEGPAVSTEEARRSVPSFVRASVKGLSVPYNGKPAVPEYTLNTEAFDAYLTYSKTYANGLSGAFSNEAPTEPGDYTVNCCVLDTVVGSGKIVIEKIRPEISLENISVPYRPDGYKPDGKTEPADIELTYSAYEYKDGKAGESVSFPLIDCGTYLISACPTDTAHYEYETKYCFVTVVPVQSTVSGTNTVVKEDGTEKEINFSVYPAFAEYSVEYYKLEKGVSTRLDGKPTEAGEYYATVAVLKNERVLPTTAVYGLYITETEARPSLAPYLRVLCIVVSLAAIGSGAYSMYKAKKQQEEQL